MPWSSILSAGHGDAQLGKRKVSSRAEHWWAWRVSDRCTVFVNLLYKKVPGEQSNKSFPDMNATIRKYIGVGTDGVSSMILVSLVKAISCGGYIVMCGISQAIWGVIL